MAGARHQPGEVAAERRRGGALRVAAGALLLALLIVGGGWLLFRSAVRPPAPAAPPPPPPVAVAPVPVVSVVSVTGLAEGSDGDAWRPLAPGDVLHAEERLRTGTGGGAELAAGDRARLTLAEQTQVQVREVTALVHRFGLARGRLLVDYQADGSRSVRVEAEEGGAVAEATSARFHVAASGLAFAVATETGRVDLRSAGATVPVAAGAQALAAAGQPPTAAAPIPRALLLKISAAAAATGAWCLAGQGRADPAALVTVGGRPVAVDEGGRFPLRVARGATGGVEVVATLADGREARRTVACRPDSDARVDDLRLRWRGAR